VGDKVVLSILYTWQCGSGGGGARAICIYLQRKKCPITVTCSKIVL
jgi:hypothetical protein